MADLASENIVLEDTENNPLQVDQSGAGGNTRMVRYRTKMKPYFAEIFSVWTLAWPLAGGYFVEMGMSIVSLMVLGHYGEEELAAAALGFSITNILGWSFGVGLLTGMDTLAAQSWGAGSYKRVGVIFQRAMAILTVYCVPTFVAWWYTEPILVFLKQDPEISKMAGTFCKIYIPGFWPGMMFEAVRRWLQSQTIVIPSMIVLGIMLPTLFLFLVLFVFVFDWGLIGCPLAYMLCNVISLLLLMGYVWVKGIHKKTWGGWTMKMFRGWGEYLRLAVPGSVMGVIEGFGFEIMTLLAGYMGTIQLDVHTLLVNTYYLAYMIPYGVGLACTTRVGNLLGEKFPSQARRCTWTTVMLNIFIEVVSGLLLIAFRRPISRLFTDEPDIIEPFVQLMPVCALVMVLDGVQVVTGAALRGSGRQRIGMAMNIIAFYCIGIPSAFVFALVAKLEVLGLWIGIGVCDGTSALFFSIILIFFSNWPKLSQEAVELAEKEAKEEEQAAARIKAEDENLEYVPLLASSNSSQAVSADLTLDVEA